MGGPDGSYPNININLMENVNMADKIVQFNGAFYHESCFENWLQTEKSKNRITSDFKPNVKEVSADSIDDTDVCNECGAILSKSEDEVVDAKVEDNDDDKGDDTVETPSPTPLDPRRRRR